MGGPVGGVVPASLQHRFPVGVVREGDHDLLVLRFLGLYSLSVGLASDGG